MAFQNKGGKHDGRQNSLDSAFHNGKDKEEIRRVGSWQQHHQRAPWREGQQIGISHVRESNELPNELPNSLDEKERNSRNGVSDNWKEDNNVVVQEYDLNINDINYHNTNWQTGGWSRVSISSFFYY